MQRAHFDALFNGTSKGLTSVVVAVKGATIAGSDNPRAIG
jgi:hypothetical protein